MASNAIRVKLLRLKSGAAPRVLDLFAGCGGLSLGFHRAGFEVSGAVESDLHAAASHAANFHPDEDPDGPFAATRDIRVTEPEELAADLRFRSVARAIDVIVGGPPCQAFARVGRAKLREVAEHPKAFLQDDRSNLYLRFLQYVQSFQPLAILVENVPDALNFGGHNIANEMCEVLDDLGYDARYTLTNAAFYGVPQMRERMFLLAFVKELRATIRFPAPTHWVKLPKGYEGTRRVALQTLALPLLGADAYYTDPPTATESLPRAVTAWEALHDLPVITGHLTGEIVRGTRRFTDSIRYPELKAISAYAQSMRSWPGFEARSGLTDHVIRALPRDYPLFARMRPGEQYPEAYRHAEAVLAERVAALPERPSESEYRSLRASLVPPYDVGKFPNKWRKMESDAPARTLMAHLGKDSYSHIHYDSTQARTISVREAARLQSFPDGFRFHGTMNPAFRQIGNAVPPLVAFAFAKVIRSTLQPGGTSEATGHKAPDGI